MKGKPQMEKEKPLTLTQAKRLLKSRQKTWLQRDESNCEYSYLACSTGVITLTPDVSDVLWNELPFQYKCSNIVQEKVTEAGWKTIKTRVTKLMASYKPLCRGV
jgi:hypothetical protein